MKVKNENQQSLVVNPGPQIVTTIAQPIIPVPELAIEITPSLEPSFAEPGKFLKTVFESFHKHFDQVNIFKLNLKSLSNF